MAPTQREHTPAELHPPPTTHETEDHAYDEQHGTDSFSPRGTLFFVLLMLLGYALYWAYLWFIVVIERGVGGI